MFVLYIMVFQFDFNQVYQKKFAKKVFLMVNMHVYSRNLKNRAHRFLDGSCAMFRPRNNAILLFLLITACQNVVFII